MRALDDQITAWPYSNYDKIESKEKKPKPSLPDAGYNSADDFNDSAEEEDLDDDDDEDEEEDSDDNDSSANQ